MDPKKELLWSYKQSHRPEPAYAEERTAEAHEMPIFYNSPMAGCRVFQCLGRGRGVLGGFRVLV